MKGKLHTDGVEFAEDQVTMPEVAEFVHDLSVSISLENVAK